MKIKQITFFKTTVSIGLLFFVFTRIDFIQAWNQFKHLSLPFIILALLYYTGCQLLSRWRWQVVLNSSGHSAPISSLLNSYFAGMFLNIFLPGTLGGDVYRVYRAIRFS